MALYSKEKNMGPNPEILLSLVKTKMPFGKYKDRLICDLPVSYLEWFQRKGFPKVNWAFNWEPCSKLKSMDWKIY